MLLSTSLHSLEQFVKSFKDENLQITIEINLVKTDFLDDSFFAFFQPPPTPPSRRAGGIETSSNIPRAPLHHLVKNFESSAHSRGMIHNTYK